MPKQTARDELARLIFVTDNAGSPDPRHEWEMASRHYPLIVEYAYILADAIIAGGWRAPVAKPADVPVLAGQETIDTALGA